MELNSCNNGFTILGRNGKIFIMPNMYTVAIARAFACDGKDSAVVRMYLTGCDEGLTRHIRIGERALSDGAHFAAYGHRSAGTAIARTYAVGRSIAFSDSNAIDGANDDVTAWT